MKNTEAVKLPDPLLVRYYKEDRIDAVKKVHQHKETRLVTVTMKDGTIDRWNYLTDVGWIPAVD